MKDVADKYIEGGMEESAAKLFWAHFRLLEFFLLLSLFLKFSQGLELKDEKARLKKKEIKKADKEFEQNIALKKQVAKERQAAAQKSAPKEATIQIQSEEGIK